MATVPIACLLGVLLSLPSTLGAAQEPVLEVIAGRDGSEVHTELHRLAVPENRADPESRSITLAVLRVRSRLESPGPPVFVLAGGPGGSGIDKVRGWARGGGMWFVDQFGGDLVAIDQRGVGLSEPNLGTSTRYGFPPEEPGDPERMRERILAVCREEAARWRAKGVDLAGYTTVESADDVEAVRHALGYETIALWGESYGTHLGMAVIRRHGEHVARALFLGPEGPDHTLKLPSSTQAGLEGLAALVAADERLGERCPDLVGLLAGVLEGLEEEPAEVELDGARVGISAFDVRNWVANAIGTIRGGGDRVPARVLELAAGDFEGLARELLEQRRADGIGSAMQMTMDSASGLSPERAREIAREAKSCLLGDAVNFPFEDCERLRRAWGVPDLGSAFREPLLSEVPILFVVGELDSRTPIRNAEELMRHLPNALLLTVENAGHGDVPLLQADLREAWSAFLLRGAVSVERVSAPRPGFALPAGG